MVFNAFDFRIDDSLKTFLYQRDRNKANKNNRQGTIEGKRKRSTKKNEKLNRKKQEFIDGHKVSTEYKFAKEKSPTAIERNPKGIPKDQLRCAYWHPLFCTVRGHNDYRNKAWAMRLKTKEEREAAKQ